MSSGEAGKTSVAENKTAADDRRQENSAVRFMSGVAKFAQFKMRLAQ